VNLDDVDPEESFTDDEVKRMLDGLAVVLEKARTAGIHIVPVRRYELLLALELAKIYVTMLEEVSKGVDGFNIRGVEYERVARRTEEN
jgi:hypothetical protein